MSFVPANITQAQFDDALAKWQAQGIEEYELQVEWWAFQPVMGTWTVRIATNGTTATVLDYRRESGGPTSALTGLGSEGLMPTDQVGINDLKEQLGELTVEHQFDILRRALAGEWANETGFEVRFDSALGNPTYVGTMEVPGQAMSSEAWSWEVKSLKVLKQRVPDTPTATSKP